MIEVRLLEAALALQAANDREHLFFHRRSAACLRFVEFAEHLAQWRAERQACREAAAQCLDAMYRKVLAVMLPGLLGDEGPTLFQHLRGEVVFQNGKAVLVDLSSEARDRLVH